MFSFNQSFFLMLLASSPPEAFARKTTRTRGLKSSGKKVGNFDQLKDLLFSGDCISLDVGKKGGGGGGYRELCEVRNLEEKNQENKAVAGDQQQEHRNLGSCGPPPIFDMCTNPDQLGGQVVELFGPGIMSAYCCDANINTEELAGSDGCSPGGNPPPPNNPNRRLAPASGISVGSPPEAMCEFPQEGPTCAQFGEPCIIGDFPCCPGQGGCGGTPLACGD